MNSITRAEKKRIGSFYTPSSLAELIAGDVLNRWFVERLGRKHNQLLDMSSKDRKRARDFLTKLRVMDPAVGDGAFLIAAGNWIDQKLKILTPSLSRSERRKGIVERSLHGIDIQSEAVSSCRENLAIWSEMSIEADCPNPILESNSLINLEGSAEYDVVLGNPPYGNILSEDERERISSKFPVNVGGGRNGTWNSAAHFIVRASMFLRQGGVLGFLVPNSILRVGQFQKTRDFLLQNLTLLKIFDEASPFDDVTLEMVTLVCSRGEPKEDHRVEVESRRPGITQRNMVPHEILSNSRVFPIYYDEIFEKMLSKGVRGMLSATRGRDIPKKHTSQKRQGRFITPYITSGRSVGRYTINEKYVTFADDWYTKDSGLLESYSKRLLVATKNYRYPRCVLKPRGFLHGGGIVRIDSSLKSISQEALALILNSRLVQHLCTRYLTNYSQLTTCLNTGIMEDLPIAIPNNQRCFEVIFSLLEGIYHHSIATDKKVVAFFETLADSLTYELYFGVGTLQDYLARIVEENWNERSPAELMKSIDRDELSELIRDIYQLPEVVLIEARMNSGY